MKFVVKREALPTSDLDVAVIDGQSRILNWLYNHLVEKATALRSEFSAIKSDQKNYSKTSPEYKLLEDKAKALSLILYTKRGLRDLIPELKKEFPFLKTVHAKPLKESAMRLSRAIQAYQREQKKGNKKQGWPSFRKWSENWFSLEYDEPMKGYNLEKIQGNWFLQVSLGKTKESKKLTTTFQIKDGFPDGLLKAVKTLKLTKDTHGRFFACFSVDDSLTDRSYEENESVLVTSSTKVAAIDPNHKNLGWLASNEGESIEIANPNFIKKLDITIDELKSKRDKTKKKSYRMEIRDEKTGEIVKTRWQPSRRWLHLNGRLQETYRIRREQKKTYLYTLAHHLYHQFDIISVGNYTPHGGGISTGMRRAMNNQSLIGDMKLIFQWVATKRSKKFHIYNEYQSTKTCSNSSVVMESINPDERIWKCGCGCGGIHLRDYNSAVNGLAKTYCDLGSDLKIDPSKLNSVLLGPSGKQIDGDTSPQSKLTWSTLRINGLGVKKLTPGFIDVINCNVVKKNREKLKNDQEIRTYA